MKELTVNLGARSYPIYIGEGLISDASLYKKLLHTRQVMVVTDTVVEKLYLSRVLETLTDFEVITHVIPSGETEKNLSNMNAIISSLLEHRYSRTACIVALGGGVVGDLAGFTASCYQRGIRFLQVPTTLLAQVDSSVGGKTAVNHPAGKNMIGAFYQPTGVVADMSVLTSLPDRELSAGLAEVIKYGLIRDAEFFSWLETNMDSLVKKDRDALSLAVEKSCINKAEVVAADETEQGLRATLNLGHTFGHAIETGLAYRHWLHGEAVAMGMIMAAHMSYLSGWLTEDSVGRIQNLILRAGLPTGLPAELGDADLRSLMSIDKKVSHGKLKLILLNEIGKAVISNDFKEQHLQETLSHFMNKE